MSETWPAAAAVADVGLEHTGQALLGTGKADTGFSPFTKFSQGHKKAKEKLQQEQWHKNFFLLSGAAMG